MLARKADEIIHTANQNSQEITLISLDKHNRTDIHHRYSSFETLESKTKNSQLNQIISDAKEPE